MGMPHLIFGLLNILVIVTWFESMIYNEFAVKPSLNNLGDVKSYAVNGNA